MSQPAAPPRLPTDDRTQRDLFAWSLLAAVLLLGATAGPFFAGRVYTRDDLGAFHLPARAFYARQLDRGEPFDWMPQLFSGFYLTGEGQAGTYHPLHWLLYRALPFHAALSWEWLLPYPAMLAGTWLLLRRRLLHRDAAMLGSLAFTFCGFNLLHFIHPNAMAVVAHVPWLLWAIDVGLVDRRPRRVVMAQAAIALLTGSQLLLGYPQYVWLSLLAEAAYAAFVLLHAAGHKTGRCTPILIAKGCGLLLGGVQLLPTLDALAQSARQSAGPAFLDSGSLHPLNLLQMVAPYWFNTRVAGQNTHELGLYAGAVPLMLIVYLLVRRRELAELKGLALATSVLGLLALLLAMGKYGRLYHLQAYLPLVGHFRFPCRYLVLVHLAAAVLASIGFVLLLRDHRHSRAARDTSRSAGDTPRHNMPRHKIPWRRFMPLWAVVVLSAALALLGLVFHDRPWMSPAPAVLAGPLLVGAAAGLVTLAASGVRWAPVVLILFTAADLGAYGLSYAVYPQSVPLAQFVASVDAPPGDRPGRVVTSAVPFDEPAQRTGNQIILAGWRRADGYAGLEPRRRLDYCRLPALQAAGVRWVKRDAAGQRIDGLIPNGSDWLEVPDPLPRVQLVTHAQPSRDPAHDIGQIALQSTALTELALLLPETPPGTAAIVGERPGRIDIRCDCPATQLLVISESFHPGWQARVDGRCQGVLRANGDFMGCLVGPGRQDVVIEFRPDSLRRGWIASLAGLALLFVFLATQQLRPQTNRGERPTRGARCLRPFDERGWQ